MQPGDAVVCSERIALVIADVEVGEVGIVQDCDEWRGYANVLFFGRLLLHMLPIEHLRILSAEEYGEAVSYYVAR